jgi:hypothetical protein
VANTRVTRTQAQVVGEGADTRVTRTQAQVVGEGANTRLTRAAAFVVADLPAQVRTTRETRVVSAVGDAQVRTTREARVVSAVGDAQVRTTREARVVVADADAQARSTRFVRTVIYQAGTPAPPPAPPAPEPVDCGEIEVGAGWGAQPWGGGAWGGGNPCPTELIPDALCDLLLFELDSLDDIFSNPPPPEVTAVATSLVQQLPTGPTDPPGPGVLCFYSGQNGNPAFPQDVAYVRAEPDGGIGTVYTLELDAIFEDIPPDFSDVAARHIGLGVNTTNGPNASLLIAQTGLAYVGAFHHTPADTAGGTLVLDGALQQIPGTAGLIVPGIPYTIRMAVSGPTNTVYVYVTPTADVDAIGHQLVAVLPTIDATELITPPSIEQSIISVDGTEANP